MRCFGEAPANIALIKYIGKQTDGTNMPLNPSLSYTTPELITYASVELLPGRVDVWEPLDAPGTELFMLSKEGQQRYLKHFAYIKSLYGVKDNFVVRSVNNFPANTGLASSASSFAALTKAALLACTELTQKPLPSMPEQAKISQHGSGSSCRSFFEPWALWDINAVTGVETIPYKSLIHSVVIIDHGSKKVSSSQAHQRVLTSPFFDGRPERARDRLKLLLEAFRNNSWDAAYKIVWEEFQDMHHLFKTASEPFNYITEQSMHFLNIFQRYWEVNGDGPLVTMDAGPNIHLLYRPDQADMARQIHMDYLLGNVDVM
jgi:diphosphomevalonate decarboxylase